MNFLAILWIISMLLIWTLSDKINRLEDEIKRIKEGNT